MFGIFGNCAPVPLEKSWLLLRVSTKRYIGVSPLLLLRGYLLFNLDQSIMIFTQEAPLTAKWFSGRSCIRIELEFRNVGFWGEGKPGVPGEKPLGAGYRTNNKLNLHMTSNPGIEPGPHWWEASAFTTAPTLLPNPLIL